MQRKYTFVPTVYETDYDHVRKTLASIGVRAIEHMAYGDTLRFECSGEMVAATYYVMQGLLDNRFVDGVAYSDVILTGNEWKWLSRRER